MVNNQIKPNEEILTAFCSTKEYIMYLCSVDESILMLFDDLEIETVEHCSLLNLQNGFISLTEEINKIPKMRTSDLYNLGNAYPDYFLESFKIYFKDNLLLDFTTGELNIKTDNLIKLKKYTWDILKVYGFKYEIIEQIMANDLKYCNIDSKKGFIGVAQVRKDDIYPPF